MLIYITFIFALLLYVSSMFLKKGRRIMMFIWGLLFVLGTAGVTANYSHHWGMKTVTTTKTTRIYSASNSAAMPINLYQPVGTSGRDNVYIYNTKAVQKKPQHTQANEKTYSTDKVTTKQPRLVTVEKRYRYRNNFYKFLFVGSGMQNKLVKRTNTLYYPKNYKKLTVKQVAALKKQVAAQQKAMQMAH